MYALKNGTPNFREVPDDYVAQAGETLTSVYPTSDNYPPLCWAGKIKALSASCKAEILAGFVSSALGAAYKYDGDLESQLNLAGAKDYAVTNNVNVDFTCTKQATGVKAAVTHTPAQIQQAFNDGAVFKMARLSKFRTLKAQVEAAATVADVKAVTW